MAAINHVNLDEFIEELNRTPTKYPRSLEYFTNNDNMASYTSYYNLPKEIKKELGFIRAVKAGGTVYSGATKLGNMMGRAAQFWYGSNADKEYFKDSQNPLHIKLEAITSQSAGYRKQTTRKRKHTNRKTRRR